MRAFSKKKATFYTGRTGRRIRALPKAQGKDAMLLADYLIAGPTANLYGLYQVDIEVIALHLPMSIAEARTAFAALENLEFAFYDEDSRWVWVQEMAAQQLDTPLKPQDNLIKSIKRWYETCPRNPFLGRFFDRYADDLCLDSHGDRSGPPVERREEAPSEGLRRGSKRGSIEPLSHSHSLIGSSSQVEGVQGEEGLPELVLEPPVRKQPDRRKGNREPTWREAAFETFWMEYPKQERRKDAWQAWVKHVKTEELAAHVIEKLRILKQFFDYSDEGKWIPAPFRWIERERWADEPPKMPNMNQRTQQTAKAVARAAQRGAPQ